MTTPHCHHELPGLRVAPASHSCAHKPRPREGDAAARNGEGTGRHSCGESHRCALPGQLPPTRAPRSGFWPVGRTKRVPSGCPSPRTRGGREAADGLCRAFLGWGFSLIHTVYFSDFPNTWPMPRSPWHSGVAGMLPADAGGGGGSVRAARTLTHSHLPAKTPGWELLKSRPRTQLFRPVSQARREAAGTASGTSNGSLVQPRTELFLCDFKIKHIREERR